MHTYIYPTDIIYLWYAYIDAFAHITVNVYLSIDPVQNVYLLIDWRAVT